MCGEVGYELSPADKWTGGTALDEETSTEWIRKLRANADTVWFEAVGVSVEDLRGIEWLNGVGRAARDGNVVADMQCEDVVKTIRGLMNDPRCLWLQVDVSGGGWALCDVPVVVDDWYVAAGALDMLGTGVGGAVAPPLAPQVVPTVRNMAEGLGLPWYDGSDDSDSDVDMGSSPLAARVGRRLVGLGTGCAKRTGPLVEPVVLFPAVPILETAVGCPSRGGTVPDSVDGDVSDLGEDPGDGVGPGEYDPACGGGSRDGGCECSFEAELGYLSGKVRKLEDLVCLLVADAGLAGWEETWRVENLKRKMKAEREGAEVAHERRVAAERAAGEEKKRIAKRNERARKAEDVRKSQEEAARLRTEQITGMKATLEVSVEECVQATTPEELVPQAAKVSEAVEGVKRAEAVPSSASEDVDVGGGWRVVGGNVVRRVEVVSRLGGPVGRARTAGLSGVVEKVQALFRSESLGWGVSAKLWSQHGSDEILWTISGVGKAVGDSVVLDYLRMNVVVVVDAAEVVDLWVEDHLSRYVVVGGIPEENWAASGWDRVRRDNPAVEWRHRGPLVVGRVWKSLTVKLEVGNAVAVGAVVKSGVMVGARRCGAQLANAAGGRGVQRGPAPAKGGAPARKATAGGVVCYGFGKAGHLRRDCRAGSVAGVGGHPRSNAGGVARWVIGCRSALVGPFL